MRSPRGLRVVSASQRNHLIGATVYVVQIEFSAAYREILGTYASLDSACRAVEDDAKARPRILAKPTQTSLARLARRSTDMVSFRPRRNHLLDRAMASRAVTKAARRRVGYDLARLS